MVDAAGKVVGIVTMKSLVTANLGFAVPINSLNRLKRPNPVAMERWLPSAPSIQANGRPFGGLAATGRPDAR